MGGSLRSLPLSIGGVAGRAGGVGCRCIDGGDCLPAIMYRGAASGGVCGLAKGGGCGTFKPYSTASPTNRRYAG